MLEKWMIVLVCPKCGGEIDLWPAPKDTVKILLKKIGAEVKVE